VTEREIHQIGQSIQKDVTLFHMWHLARRQEALQKLTFEAEQ
jgi:hypothetical protein